ncbi:unnamed protein product, partial [Symbiodinium sp. CCMP2456]
QFGDFSPCHSGCIPIFCCWARSELAPRQWQPTFAASAALAHFPRGSIHWPLIRNPSTSPGTTS